MQAHLLFVKATSLDDHYPRYCVLSHIQNLHLELLIYTNKENILLREKVKSPILLHSLTSTQPTINWIARITSYEILNHCKANMTISQVCCMEFIWRVHMSWVIYKEFSASNWNSYTLKKKMTNGEKDQNDELESQNPWGIDPNSLNRQKFFDSHSIQAPE